MDTNTVTDPAVMASLIHAVKYMVCGGLGIFLTLMFIVIYRIVNR